MRDKNEKSWILTSKIDISGAFGLKSFYKTIINAFGQTYVCHINFLKQCNDRTDYSHFPK